MATRPLTLHSSALSNEEYGKYVSALRDLADVPASAEDGLEKMQVGLREVRAWLRGRYTSNSQAKEGYGGFGSKEIDEVRFCHLVRGRYIEGKFCRF